MHKKWILIIILVICFIFLIPKAVEYTEFRNGQENLYNWVQTFEVTDTEEVNATIFRENIAPKRYLFTADETEELLNILKAVPKEAFVQARGKSLDGISVYICRWKFDETAKSDLLLSYTDGYTMLGLTKEQKEELRLDSKNQNWVIEDASLSEFMEKHIDALETRQNENTVFTYTDEGYIYHAETDKIPMSEFSSNMGMVSADIIQQFQEYDHFSSKSPDCWYRSFENSAKAREFIGYAALRAISWPLEEQKTQLLVCGNENGDVQYMCLETDYQIDDIRLQAFSYLYTEHDKEPCTHEVILENGLEYEDSVYRTKSGMPCHVMAVSANVRGYCTKTGYMTIDGILYMLNIAYQKADAEQAEKLLYQWADQFE